MNYNKKKLNIATWNVCNGLLHKLDYVKDLLNEHKIDILFLQEAELKTSNLGNHLNIPGYIIETSVSSSTIRTVAYIQKDVIYKRVIEKMDTNVIKLNMDSAYEINQIVGIYRPFKQLNNESRYEHFKSQIKEITDFLQDGKNSIITGDFNLDYAKSSQQNYIHRAIYNLWLEATYAFNLLQLVEEITWTRIYQGTSRTSILDHAYCNNSLLIEEILIEKQSISDHSAIIIRSVGRVSNKEYVYFESTSWKNYSKENLNNEIKKHNLRELLSMDEQQIADNLDQILGSVRDELLVTKTIRKKESTVQYPTFIIELKTKLKNLHKRAKQAKSTSLLRKSRCLEKKIRKLVFESKKIKIRAEADLGPNNLWKAAKIALDKPIESLPRVIQNDTIEANTDKQKADMFMDHFHNKVDNITKNLKPASTVYNGKRKIFGTYANNWVTPELVAHIIDNLKTKRCEGFDRIPLVFYVDGKEELLEVLTNLMAKIMKNGRVPEQWKIAKVVPLHKKGKTNDVNNYRPISNLCSITKIFERLILHRINFIENQERVDLTGSFQHGFKVKHGTETACLDIQSRIAEMCDHGETVALSTIDLTAAFDVVNHELLQKRLKILGLPTALNEVIRDWLHGRSFYCQVNNSVSQLKNITHGTVQGSILGPILFALFIAPLEDITSNLTAYADDNYQLSGNEKEEIAVQRCVYNTEKLMTWMTESALKINESKTELCLFSRKDVKMREVIINEVRYEIKRHIKILGITFDSKLSWYQHVISAINGANKAKQAIKIIAKYFTRAELVKMATSYFYSKLYYGAKVWLISTLVADLKRKLWQASSYMLRVIERDWTGAYSFMELHKRSLRATPQMWSNYVTACAMYETVTFQPIGHIMPKLNMNMLTSTRRKGLSFTRSNLTKIGFNCITNRLQKVSSRLDIDFSQISHQSFKTLCKKTFIQNEFEKN